MAQPTACRLALRTFSQSTMDEARKSGWNVVSMKDDWKQVFSFQE